jgi:hypothetical protein
MGSLSKFPLGLTLVVKTFPLSEKPGGNMFTLSLILVPFLLYIFLLD